MGNSFKWASLKKPQPVDVDKTFFGPLGVVGNGTDYDGHEGPELAQDFANNVKDKDLCSFFAPTLEGERVDDKGKPDPDGYNFLGATLKRIVEEGILEPVIMGKWIKIKGTKKSFPSPYLAFFAPEEDAVTPSKKAPAKRKKTRFSRA
jgi:hypothetical protein